MTTDLRTFAYASVATVAALAAAAHLMAPASVFEVATPITVSETATYRGELAGQRDVDLFSVRLEAGKDYAFALAIDSWPRSRLELRDPRGAVVGSAEAAEDPNGFEARPATSGVHTLRVSGAEPDAGSARVPYGITARRDCPRHRTATRCVLPLGRTTGEKRRGWAPTRTQEVRGVCEHHAERLSLQRAIHERQGFSTLGLASQRGTVPIHQDLAQVCDRGSPGA